VETLRLLLLMRSRRERDWSVEELSAELRSSPNAIRKRLGHAEERHLVARSGDVYRYHYAPESDASLALLGKLYRERRTQIIDLIFSHCEA
jgi:DeoR/GlpR family transcriptional regulator of sugar metabolism